ncbi:MAG: DUF4910 domain-containing protein [Desulfurococcaceae archaeon TW002]
MSVSSLLKDVKSDARPYELIELVMRLSSYHRIQGSRELIEASDFIRASLEESGSDVSVEVFNYANPPKWLSPLVGWDLINGEVRITYPEKGILSSVKKAFTAVAGHSPPGEFSGRVSYAESEDLIPDDVEVLLTSNRSLDMYFKAVEKGAKAVLIYRKDAPLRSIPYIGLFPTPDETYKMRAPVLCIPRRSAEKMKTLLNRGEKVVVEGFVKSVYSDPREFRVVTAEFGDSEKEIHITAHYCHPKGTVNDNVSGAATLLYVAKLLSKQLSKTACCLQGIKVRFVWVPEHYGSLALVRKLLEENIEILGTLNLDMIGEKQKLTNSVLNFIRSPVLLLNMFEAHAFRNFSVSLGTGWGLATSSTRKSLLRFELKPYEAGSDHDAYVVFGIPAVSLTNWPDKFYHTNLDSIDKFSPINSLRIVITALRTALTFKPSESQTQHYVNFARESEYFSLPESLYEIRQNLYEKRGTCKISRELAGYPSPQYLLRTIKEPEVREEVKKFLSRASWTVTAYIIAILYSSCGFSASDLRKSLVAELGVRIDDKDFNTILKSIELLRNTSM